MTLIEFYICVAAFVSLSTEVNQKFNLDTHRAIAENICAAANKEGTNPIVLAAYILTENRRFDPFLDKAAGGGVDRGLYHANSRYHGHRPNYNLINHPYYATEIASQTIRENFAKFGNNWQGVAAYWNPKKAKEKDKEAFQYYERWLANFRIAERAFKAAEQRVNSGLGQGKR